MSVRATVRVERRYEHARSTRSTSPGSAASAGTQTEAGSARTEAAGSKAELSHSPTHDTSRVILDFPRIPHPDRDALSTLVPSGPSRGNGSLLRSIANGTAAASRNERNRLRRYGPVHAPDRSALRGCGIARHENGGLLRRRSARMLRPCLCRQRSESRFFAPRDCRRTGNDRGARNCKSRVEVEIVRRNATVGRDVRCRDRNDRSRVCSILVRRCLDGSRCECVRMPCLSRERERAIEPRSRSRILRRSPSIGGNASTFGIRRRCRSSSRRTSTRSRRWRRHARIHPILALRVGGGGSLSGSE